MVGFAFGQFLLPLVVTIVIEVFVAASLGLRARALGAVVAVNLVTNPILTAVMASLYWQGVGYKFVVDRSGGQPPYPEQTTTAPWIWAVVVLFELTIILVEWRMLVWALAGSGGGQRKLLRVSFLMNAVSAILGTWLLSYPIFYVLGCFSPYPQ